MEHIFRPDVAFREAARTLKPGGAHIFTTPLTRKDQPTRRRAELVNGTGYDIGRHIFEACGLFTQMIHIDDLSLGIRAEYIEVLVTTKLPR